MLATLRLATPFLFPGLAVLAKLGGGNVHADLDLAGVASLLDGLDEELEALIVGLDVGGEATSSPTNDLRG